MHNRKKLQGTFLQNLEDHQNYGADKKKRNLISTCPPNISVDPIFCYIDEHRTGNETCTSNI